MTIKKPKEKLIVYGFDELKEVFETEDFVNITKKNFFVRNIVLRIFKRILNFLGDNRILSTIQVNKETVFENFTREATSYTKHKGIIKSITFVKLGYFQSEAFFDPKVLEKLRIKDVYILRAKKFLDSVPPNFYKVAVHIRLGDYKDFLVYGKSPILPMSYFHKCINWFLENRKDCFFIFLSDEPNFVQSEFSYLVNKKISVGNDTGTDFAIITQCNGAILSSSSFGWWGSYFMQNRDIVFAPKHWLGFRSNENYHKSPLASYMVEVDVGGLDEC